MSPENEPYRPPARQARTGRRTFLASSLGTGLAMSLSATPEAETGPWPERRAAMREAWLELLGPFPESVPPLDPKQIRVDDIDGIECHHVTFQSEADDRVPAYLLIPEAARPGPSPALLCIHSTTQGSGKRRIVGLSGATPEDPPDEPPASRSYGLELARWGYITFCIDLICDGERIPEGLTCYDTSAFYEKHPEWSAVGKNTWDAMRAIDFLETLDLVDASRIGCIGHSLGGHSSLFTAAFDERIAAVVANGGQLSWVRDTDHWSRPTEQKRGPVSDYVYIKRFRPYIEDPSKPVPADFEHLMMMVAPRPMLISATEGEIARDDSIEKLAQAAAVYRELGAGDRPSLFSFPGKHNYPPVAKRNSFNWLDRWLDHTPAVPTIWPDVRV